MMAPLIAVVDDEQPVVELLCELLADEGYRTMCCQHSDAAFAAIKAQHPALIVLDIQMETEEAGLHVLSLFRHDSETSTIPVILCTARPDIVAAKAGWLHGQGCLILEKPFALDGFVQLMHAFVPLPS
jgi:two-component system nitrogen regulation response regulator NtrX